MEFNEKMSFCTLFKGAVKSSGNKKCCFYKSEVLTYEELDIRSDYLLDTLRNLGVKNDDNIAIYMNRNIGLLTSIVAVLKNGSAYLPIDTTHPVKRKNQIISQSKVKYFITDTESKEELVSLLDGCDIDNNPKILEINDKFFGNMKKVSIDYQYNPEGTAYIMFTSGSTGMPKGVMVKHKGMVNHLLSKINDMGICEKDIIVESATQCFDISVWQFLSCLLVGGQVHILDNETAGNPEAYLDYIDDKDITIFQVVPSMLKSMLNYINSTNKKYNMKALRWIALVGEALPPYVCRKWFELFPTIPMLNSYGPTECSDGVSHYIVKCAPDKSVINMPIGKPINNLKVYITKTNSNEIELVSEGETEGELCVSGIGVGKGYLYDPERTSKVFLNNPFSTEPGYEMLYKTGDLVKMLPSGDMEYLGRIDRQVKLRGFRIELGEIESVLAECEEVQSCAVITSNLLKSKQKLVARKGTDIDKSDDSIQLIAYIIENKHLTDKEYRTILEGKLPFYMVPERFVRVEEFPYNTNGKLDIKKLPDPNSIRPETEYDYVEPITKDEKVLAQIWAKILNIDKIGRNDYFFDLGGDSLLSMQLINRVREEMDCIITFKDIFTNCLSDLLEVINRKRENCEKNIIMEKIAVDRELYPLTLQQKQLWFMWKMYPDSPFYMLQGELDVKGCSDIDILKKAIMEVVSGNDLLGANLVEKDGEPFFSFSDNSKVNIDYQDISEQSEGQQCEVIKKYEKNEIAHPFDLGKEALVRFKLYKLSDANLVLVMTTHEMIFDAWSLSTFIREVKTVYGDIVKNNNVEIFDNKVSFKQYSVWESENITKETLSKEREYWSKQLMGYDSYLDLPRVNHSEITSHEGGTVTKLLSKDLSDKLKNISRKSGATLFMTLLAGFNALLYRYTGQDDIIVGTPHVNRNNPNSEKLYGFFLNMLPIRTKINGRMPFNALLEDVRDTVYNSIENSNYPFMWITDDHKQSSQISSPLFQVMFNMYSEKTENDNADDILNISFREIETGYTKYDMTLYAQENDENIYIQLSYFKDMFDEGLIENMIDNYEVLLQSIAENTQATIDEVDYITADEKNKLLFELNDTDAAYNKTTSISEIFEQCVEKNKDKTALICNGREMTYSELNDKANCLANILMNEGVDNSSVVGLSISRSFNTIITILAVLKLGATYVALDQSYPIARLYKIIEDSEIDILVKDKFSPVFDGYSGPSFDVECIDDRKKYENIKYKASVNGLMNIVYTSSTTGEPKGVKISMQSVLNRIYWMWNNYPFNSSDVAVLQKSTALVAASWELFGGLCFGVPTVILTQEDISLPSQLLDCLVDNNVTYLLSSPAFIRIVLDEMENSGKKWTSLRVATTSAEPINKALVQRWYEFFPNVHLLNLYGSTECSSNASGYDTYNIKEEYTSVPIGRPLSNVRLLILDKNRQLVPYGVKGELCIWGDCVSKGYLHLKHLTAEKYISDRFYGSERQIYCSGDVACYLNDGNINLVGRTDYQVKIRGYRVELPEIESVLNNHSAVKNAVCQTEEDNLVAYLVIDNDSDIDEIKLKKYLREYLPEYMIPTEFRLIEKLPITNAGKINRKLLSQLEYSLLGLQDSNDKEYDVIEKKVRDIFVDVLGRDNIDKNVDFFDVGGNSLLSIRVVTEIKRLFGIEIMISSFMRNSSILSIAQQIKEA